VTAPAKRKERRESGEEVIAATVDQQLQGNGSGTMKV
jgi:hypothetical protein